MKLMKITSLLHYIDAGHLALPPFTRESRWSPSRVCDFCGSLYRDFPVGSLILWAPSVASTASRDEVPVELILDGQQRVIALYWIARGRLPAFLGGPQATLPSLSFHIDRQTFAWFEPSMQGDPLWIELPRLLGEDGQMGKVLDELYRTQAGPGHIGVYSHRLSQLLRIVDRHIATEYLPGDALSTEAMAVRLLANAGRG